MKRDINNSITLVIATLVMVNLARGLWVAPVDVNQGEVYRIMYLHVPCAISAFVASFVLLLASVIAIAKKNLSALRVEKAASEVGLVFTIVTLATGSIWGRPTWGVWWVWDARLTTTLILALLYAGFLLVYSSSNPGEGRLRTSSILGILISIDVPIIYKSVDWWRTIHQGHSLLTKSADPMNPAIKSILVSGIFSMMAYCLWLIRLRYISVTKQEAVEQLSYDQV